LHQTIKGYIVIVDTLVAICCSSNAEPGKEIAIRSHLNYEISLTIILKLNSKKNFSKVTIV